MLKRHAIPAMVAAVCIGLGCNMSSAESPNKKDALTPARQSRSADIARPPTHSYSDVLSRAIPSVVTVRVTSEDQVPVDFSTIGSGAPVPKPEYRRARSGGSGVIIDAGKGLVLTNNHVIEGAVEIDVVLSDGRLMRARLIGRDIGTDLAVLEVEGRQLKAMPLGNSDSVRVGDVVLAIGNPFGLEGTATMGIVSASMRTEIGHEAFEDFLQIDAVINPGNSGGALINTRGELIGINTATAGKAGNVGIGFAIPINMAMIIKNELVLNGRMRRGSLGLLVEDLSYERAQSLMSGTNRGALVTSVVAGSSADKAGIKPGAIVTQISGKPVRGTAEYQTRVVTVPIGTKLSVQIREGAQERLVTLESTDLVEPRPEQRLTAVQGGLEGAVIKDIGPGSKHFGDVRGAEVARVDTGSSSEKSGIRAGDVIVGIDDRAIVDSEHLVRFSERTGMSYLLKIRRDGIGGWLRITR